jgi:hypothetical protein
MLGHNLRTLLSTYAHLVPSMAEEQVARLDAVWSRDRHHIGTTDDDRAGEA